MVHQHVLRRPAKIIRWFILLGVSLLISLLLLEVALRVGGGLFLFLQEQANRHSLQKGSTYTIVAFGESTTGLGGKDSWPSQLEKILNQSDIGITFSVINKGVPGTTSTNILEKTEAIIQEYKPQMIISMMGVNDTSLFEKNNQMTADPKNKQNGLFGVLEDARVVKLVVWVYQSIGERLQRSRATTGDTEGRLPYIMPGPKLDITKTWDLVEFANWNIDQDRYKEAEFGLEDAIKTDPTDVWPYVELANLYRNQQRFENAKKLYEQALLLRPDIQDIYIELADVYRGMQKFGAAEKLLADAQSLRPTTAWFFVERALLYRDIGKTEEAVSMMERALQLDPSLNKKQTDIGTQFRHIRRYEEVEKGLLQYAAKHPDDESIYIKLGDFYETTEKKIQEEQMRKKTLALNISNAIAYEKLLMLLWEQQRRQEIEDLLRQASGAGISSDLLLAQINQRINSIPIVQPLKSLASPILFSNYKKLKDISLRHRITLVAVQYPLRDISPLKEWLGGDGVVFVSNEQIFQDALQNSSYEALFTDRFAGDFGHATARGNELIASKIAETLRAEVFKR